MKKLKLYQNVKSTGTSLVTLLLPKNYQISIARQSIKNEYSTASNIKSRTNRLSVQRALRSIQHKLKAMNEIPATGMALMAGQYI
jgi:peptide chain release factor subunit 1